MAKPTIYFICPDLQKPLGGVRMMYRQVDILNANGFEACIVHHQKDFRIDWFEQRTRVVHEPVAMDREKDIAVFSEIGGLKINKWEQTRRRVIFNQNVYYTYARYPVLGQVEDAYTDPRLLAAIVVSEDSKEYLEYAYPRLKVHRIYYSINGALYFPEPKKREICFMPRKNLDDARQVMNILRCRGALRGWDVVVIDGMKEAQAAAVMRESAVFLSFGAPEGFGLPPAEALRCRCLTIGYHGAGGREFMLPSISFPIEVGNIVGFARTAEEVMRSYSGDETAFARMTEAARDFIAETYSVERERETILRSWGKILST